MAATGNLAEAVVGSVLDTALRSTTRVIRCMT